MPLADRSGGVRGQVAVGPAEAGDQERGVAIPNAKPRLCSNRLATAAIQMTDDVPAPRIATATQPAW